MAIERIDVGHLSESQRAAFTANGTIDIIDSTTNGPWGPHTIQATYRIVDSGPDWVAVEVPD